MTLAFSPLFPQLEDLRAAQSRNQSSTATTLRELRETKSRIDDLVGKISDLEGTNATLLTRVRDLERQVRREQRPGGSGEVRRETG